jgi:hypothetical protein
VNPEGRFYTVLVVSVAGLLCTMGVAISILTVSSVLGPFRFLAPSEDAGVERVGLWLPPSAQTGDAEERLRRLRAWRGAVSHERDSLVAAEISTFREESIRTIAVVDARRLSDDEALHLLGFVHGGGSVLVTGPVGTEGRDGARRGSTLMKKVLGTPTARVLPRAHTAQLASEVRGPIAAPVDPGDRVTVQALAGRGVVEVDDPELVWVEDEARSGASLRRVLGRGRLAWIAAGPEDAVAAHSRELLSGGALTRVLESALAWLTGEARVEVLQWPGGAPFAALRVPADAPGLSPEAKEGPKRTPGSPNRGVLRERARLAARRADLVHVADLVESQPDADPRSVEEAALEVATQQGAWVANGGEYAQWRRGRRELGLRLTRTGPNRLVLDVSNGGDRLSGAVVRVHLNAAVLDVEVVRTILQQEKPVALFRPDRAAVDIVLPPMRQRDQQSFAIDLERLEEV